MPKAVMCSNVLQKIEVGSFPTGNELSVPENGPYPLSPEYRNSVTSENWPNVVQPFLFKMSIAIH